jgi:DNA repair protein RadA/Sms
MSRIRSLAEIEQKTIEWLWCPYIAKGKITLIEGDPSAKKSWLTLAIAKAVASGTGLPDTKRTPPAKVLLMNAEDDLEDTIRPRLSDTPDEALARILPLSEVPTLDENGFKQLDKAIRENTPALVIIDPLFAYLQAGLNPNRADHTRPLLSQLSKLAARSNCAIVAVRHLNKRTSDQALYRGMGSIDLTAACRSVLLVVVDPQDSSKSILFQIKSNLAAQGAAIAYRVRNNCFTWLGPCDLVLEHLLESKDKRSALRVAEEFLETELAEGPQLVQDIMAEANASRISISTIRQAKEEMKIDHFQAGIKGKRGRGPSYWKLPDGYKFKHLPPGAARVERNSVDHLENDPDLLIQSVEKAKANTLTEDKTVNNQEVTEDYLLFQASQDPKANTPSREDLLSEQKANQKANKPSGESSLEQNSDLLLHFTHTKRANQSEGENENGAIIPPSDEMSEPDFNWDDNRSGCFHCWASGSCSCDECGGVCRQCQGARFIDSSTPQLPPPKVHR